MARLRNTEIHQERHAHMYTQVYKYIQTYETDMYIHADSCTNYTYIHTHTSKNIYKHMSVNMHINMQIKHRHMPGQTLGLTRLPPHPEQ